jgi:single-stranded-DNA-specific exonuclease
LSWYLTAALKSKLPSAAAIDIRNYLDLACLGTICDMVPLRGVNRVIASKGLSLLSQTQRHGLLALKKAIGTPGEINGNHVGFGIGPRINAAGRMVNGSSVVTMLTTRDGRKADTIAERLNRLNKERQDTETRIKNTAFAQVETLSKLPAGIVLYDDSFHTGVIGIVAQRLSEAFYRPSVVAGRDGDFYKASVRGVKGFSVVGALNACAEHLEKFGGHEGAGGLSVSIDKIEGFISAFNLECERQLASLPPQPLAVADTVCTLEELTVQAIESLKVMAPFGMGNAAPQFAIENLHILSVEVLKGAHLKVTVSDKNISRSALLWRCTEHPELFVGNKVSVVCKPEINSFRGVNDVQLQLQAVVSAR